jgi:hypothetical protein
MELIEHEGKLYKLIRSFKKEKFVKSNSVDKEFLKDFRDYLMCDHVLQNDSHFMFCNTVPEATIENE